MVVGNGDGSGVEVVAIGEAVGGMAVATDVAIVAGIGVGLGIEVAGIAVGVKVVVGGAVVGEGCTFLVGMFAVELIVQATRVTAITLISAKRANFIGKNEATVRN